jgi:DNA-binding response OmpR family regulator
MPDPKDALILVVDDDLSILQLFEQTLQMEGYRVETASSGGDALSKIERLKPALVTLDLMLPDFGGIELLELMRRRAPAEIPSVIVITGRLHEEETREALKREPNVVAYIDKPVRPTELVAAVRKVVGPAPAKAK